MFVGRKDALVSLERIYRLDCVNAVTVNGPRRVGKSALIREFVKDKEVLYLKGFESSPEIILEVFSRIVDNAFPPEAYSKRCFGGIEELFVFLFMEGSRRRYVLALDDFDVLLRSVPYLSSMLSAMISRYREECSFLIIIAKNSDIQMLSESSLVMNLSPLTLAEAQEMLKARYGYEDIFRIYAITGGIPLYLAKFLSYRTCEDAVYELFLEDVSFFRTEVENFFLSNFRSTFNNGLVAYCLSKGINTSVKLSGETGLSTPLIASILSNLERIGVVLQEEAFGASKRRVRWILSDSLVRFYCLFCFSTGSYMPEARRCFYKDNAHLFYRYAFEKFFSENFHRFIPDRNILSSGTWWGRNPATKEKEEIRVIAKAQDGSYIIGAVFWDRKVTRFDLERLRLKADHAISVRRKVYVVYGHEGFSIDSTMSGAWRLIDKAAAEKIVFC